MRNLIEIRRGLFIRADKIEAIENRPEDGVVKVYTSGNNYNSDIPFQTLESLLEAHFDMMRHKEKIEVNVNQSDSQGFLPQYHSV